MEQLKREFTIPDNCSKDIELMSIWSQAYEIYAEELTDVQMNAAITWFHSWIESKPKAS